LHPEEWQAVADGVSEIFGGAPLTIGMLISGVPDLQPRYVSGMTLDDAVPMLELLVMHPAWSNRIASRYTNEFGDMTEDLGGIDVRSTPLFEDWIKPRGLAAAWPVGHATFGESKQPILGFLIFRREGHPPFSEADYAEANRLVPHLRRAALVQARLGGAHSAHLALGEVVDRLPTGVFLLDARRRVTVRNQAAERILALDDGLSEDRNGLSAVSAHENAELQRLIARALDDFAESGADRRGFAAISRPSGKQGFGVMVSPLLAGREPTVARDVGAVVFVRDPEAGTPPISAALERIYSLTHSEAEIVRLLAGGVSLEEAARSRGVSINTARSHLQRAFAKTGTSRQGELVRLIITGIGGIGDG